MKHSNGPMLQGGKGIKVWNCCSRQSGNASSFLVQLTENCEAKTKFHDRKGITNLARDGVERVNDGLGLIVQEQNLGRSC